MIEICPRCNMPIIGEHKCVFRDEPTNIPKTEMKKWDPASMRSPEAKDNYAPTKFRRRPDDDVKAVLG